jgi:hypothetical protein
MYQFDGPWGVRSDEWQHTQPQASTWPVTHSSSARKSASDRIGSSSGVS